MKPTVGRVVHYRAHGTPIREDGSQAFPSVCRAAHVTEVGAWIQVPGPHNELDTEANQFVLEMSGAFGKTRLVIEEWCEDACHLDVRNPTGGFFNVCRHDEDTKVAGTWHWPEREEE